MATKCCTKCGLTKSMDDFHNCKSKKDGKKSQCKLCRNGINKIYRKDNPHVAKNYYKENKEHILEYQQKYSEQNREKINNYRREKYNNDINFAISSNLRGSLIRIIHGANSKVINLIGLSHIDYLRWIEYQFEEGMSFSNYGQYWEIDHVIPLSSFNLLDEPEKNQAMNWINLRPITVTKNKSKFNKVNRWLLVCQEIKSLNFIKLYLNKK